MAQKFSEEVKPGIYKHYKGKLYEVTGVAHHSETLQKLVVYKALYATDDFAEGSLWVRPLEMFSEKIVVDGVQVKRFAFMQ